MITHSRRLSFPRLDPRLEPLVARVMRKHGGVPLRRAAMIGAGLALITATAAFITALLPDRDDMTLACLLAGVPIRLLLRLGLFALPVIAIVFAAQLAERDMSSGALDLLKLTGLPAEVIFEGYILSTLYILRVPLALLTGLAPALAIYGGGFEPVSSILNVAALILSAALSLWGYTLLGAAVSAHAVLSRNSVVSASVMAVVVLAGVWFVSFLGSTAITVFTVLFAWDVMQSGDLMPLAWLSSLVSVLPVWIAVWVEMSLRWRLAR